MAKRKEQADAGVPQWIVTYGDLMSLLLCFFILLAAFSELKQERQYLDVLQSIKDAFGFEGGVGPVPSDSNAENSPLIRMNEPAFLGQLKQKVDESTIRNMVGRETKVTTIHEGTKFTVGGAVAFDAGSILLKPDAEDDLRKVAQIIRGRNNRILVRGHAYGRDDDASGGTDLYLLSYRRAAAVGAFLIDECGIDPAVLSYEARGPSEPARTRAYTAQEQAANRRVEIIYTEEMINETNPELTFTSEQPPV